MGTTGAAGAVQAYLGIEYTPGSLDEGPPEGPDLIWLENMEQTPAPLSKGPPRNAAHQYMKIIRPRRPVSTTVC